MTYMNKNGFIASSVILGTLIMTVGCSAVKKDSSGLEYDPEVRKSQEVVHEVGGLSSRVLEILAIKGKTTEAGPSVGPCDASGDESRKYRNVRHPWSMYGVENGALEKGMENLHNALPQQGWKVVKYGKDSSRNRNLEIMAVHLETHTQLEATWMKGLDGHAPLIEITLYSRCYEEKS
ncbi:MULTISPECIES: hypothetical protein [Streptomyces]|uniref:Lipoprotein n=1 Tax=Streptomyces siderophoricus TaxID=2802281 RepID=A0ABS1MLP3_9ACTN|nr:hypothetical protein [Streptomyces sp. 9-7]MBL1088596.1 hypothetical protein [Streptomyces sp. 9-7]